MGEDAQDHLDRLTDLGWLNCEYSEEKDYYEYGIHPLLSDVLYQKYQPSAEKYANEIVNIDAFVTQFFRYGTSYLCPILQSVAIKMNGTSQEWKKCKSNICLWLCHNREIKKAYEIYRISATTFEFSPEIYKFLQAHYPEDDTISKALKEHHNYFELKADAKEAHKKLFTTNNPSPPNVQHTLNDAVFISVHEELALFLKTANNKINEFRYCELPRSLYVIANTIYNYRSFNTVNETPRRIDSDTFLDFIKKQIKCKTIEETDIYKTYLKCCTTEEQTQRLTMFNNLNILRDTLMKAAFITYVTDFWCGSPNGSMSRIEITRQFENFIYTNSMHTNRNTLLLWKIQLGYMYIQCCEFVDSDRVLTECKKIKSIDEFFLQMQLEICEYYRTSVELMWQHKHTYPIATPRKLFIELKNARDKTINNIKEKAKHHNGTNPNVLIAHTLSRYLNIHIYAIEYISIQCGNDYKNDIKKASDYFYSYLDNTVLTDAVIEIMTGLVTIPDNFFDAIENNPQIQ